MDKYELFKEFVGKAAEKFSHTKKGETIKVVSHYDCDGLAACSIIVKALRNDDRSYSISIVKGLDMKTLEELRKDDSKNIIFTDLGSGYLKLIKETLKDKSVLILDHHNPVDADSNGNLIHVNPHLFSIDGGKEISGAGVAFLFAKALDRKNELMAHIAIIGAIGDMQENNGFLYLNEEIMKIAERHGKLKVTKGIKLFGSQTRPLHKVLEYCTNPFIPGVTGSETGSIKFLQKLDIDPKRGAGWRKISHLTQEEMEKIIVGIIIASGQKDVHETIVGNIYTLPEEEEESILRDAREFSTLLNACGRMDKPMLGIGCCLNDKKIKQEAINHMQNYKKELISALSWYNSNKGTGKVTEEKGFVIINAGTNIPASMIGTVASIISKNPDFPDSTFVMSLARAEDNKIKVSLRISGRPGKGIDLKSIIEQITEKTGGESGGHKYAAGAVIDKDNEKGFIEAAKEILKKYA
jgi:RecJ-like exonuclease